MYILLNIKDKTLHGVLEITKGLLRQAEGLLGKLRRTLYCKKMLPLLSDTTLLIIAFIFIHFPH